MRRPASPAGLNLSPCHIRGRRSEPPARGRPPRRRRSREKRASRAAGRHRGRPPPGLYWRQPRRRGRGPHRAVLEALDQRDGTDGADQDRHRHRDRACLGPALDPRQPRAARTAAAATDQEGEAEGGEVGPEAPGRQPRGAAGRGGGWTGGAASAGAGGSWAPGPRARRRTPAPRRLGRLVAMSGSSTLERAPGGRRRALIRRGAPWSGKRSRMRRIRRSRTSR